MRLTKPKKWTLVLLMALGIMILSEPVIAARKNRKQSGSASNSSRARQAPRTNSSTRAQSSRSIRPTGQVNMLAGRRPGATSGSSQSIFNSIGKLGQTRTSSSRISRKSTTSGYGTIFDGTRKNNKALITRPDTDSSINRDLHSNSRLDRKEHTEYYDSQFKHSSLYSYHREYYPHRKIFYWISWPDCCRPICYTWGPSFTFGYFWPYYHRKFIFISLGGYWPCYTYRRYYWYGCHPYRWYGDCPPRYVIAGDTYNYYYYCDDPPRGDALSEARKRLEEKPPAEPQRQTRADRYFEEAVKAFEAGDYDTSAAKFNDALELAPDDIVLPFAYVQALFAGGEYKKAADVLRKALIKASPEKEGVFYPRGLYSDDGILQQQAEQLAEVVELEPFDADLKLLLGYQLLGMGRFGEAVKHLQSARLDCNNSQAATVLMNLLEKLRKADKNNVGSNQQQAE